MVLSLALAAGCDKPPAVETTTGDMEQADALALYEFPDAFEAGRWIILNDTVMGGVSQSSFGRTADGTALFAGDVSLANFGGFASVRSPHGEFELSDYQGLAVRVRGDGRPYKLYLKHDLADDGTMYWADIDPPKDEWATLRVPFERFEPHRRGMPLLFRPAANARTVRAVGFLIADKQSGPFRLEVDWIKAYGQ
jgi:monofunctional biosynthetic peptidoglycan transglycosylase